MANTNSSICSKIKENEKENEYKTFIKYMNSSNTINFIPLKENVKYLIQYEIVPVTNKPFINPITNNPIINPKKEKQELLKIPFFVHYNNLLNYVGTENNMLQACSFKFNNETIYLVKTYILPKDEHDPVVNHNIEFRPNSFYMDASTDYNITYELHFFGKLEIINLKTTKKTIKENVEVYSHLHTFSPPQNLLNLKDDLEIDVLHVNIPYIYYVIFTPLDKKKPVFKGFYFIEFIDDVSVIIGGPNVTNWNDIKNNITPNINPDLLKGGRYHKKMKKNIKKTKYKLYKSYKSYKSYKIKKKHTKIINNK